MKKLVIVSALFVATATLCSWSNIKQIKPGTSATTTLSAAKLAEAKAALSKANTRNTKSTLGFADGGI